MVDNSQRQMHGALLDAEILAVVFLLMTGGQTQLFGSTDARDKGSDGGIDWHNLQAVDASGLHVIYADAQELKAHEEFIALLAEKSGTTPIWRQMGPEVESNDP